MPSSMVVKAAWALRAGISICSLLLMACERPLDGGEAVLEAILVFERSVLNESQGTAGSR